MFIFHENCQSSKQVTNSIICPATPIIFWCFGLSLNHPFRLKDEKLRFQGKWKVSPFPLACLWRKKEKIIQAYLKNPWSRKNDGRRGEHRCRRSCCGEEKLKSTLRAEDKAASGRLFLLTKILCKNFVAWHLDERLKNRNFQKQLHT